MSNPNNNSSIGVICARFQVADLHEGHKWLINEVAKRHQHVLVLLGTTIVKNSPRNPLTFGDRKAMLEKTVLGTPGENFIHIAEIKDHSSDFTWSKMVDTIITDHLLDLLSVGFGTMTDFSAPRPEAVIYGARDSALPYYKGVFSTHQLEEPESLSDLNVYSGTAIRQAICGNPPHTRDYRMGRIIQAADRYPINYMCVDAIIYNPEKEEVLLGRKPGEDKFRFIGGFSDPTDESLEAAAIREAGEEVIVIKAGDVARPINIVYAQYLKSVRIDDSRYRAEPDKIMSAIIMCETADYDNVQGADDIEEVGWLSYAELIGTYKTDIMEAHKVIAEALIEQWFPAQSVSYTRHKLDVLSGHELDVLSDASGN